jgi:hypothetical protein
VAHCFLRRAVHWDAQGKTKKNKKEDTAERNERRCLRYRDERDESLTFGERIVERAEGAIVFAEATAATGRKI